MIPDDVDADGEALLPQRRGQLLEVAALLPQQPARAPRARIAARRRCPGRTRTRTARARAPACFASARVARAPADATRGRRRRPREWCFHRMLPAPRLLSTLCTPSRPCAALRVVLVSAGRLMMARAQQARRITNAGRKGCIGAARRAVRGWRGSCALPHRQGFSSGAGASAASSTEFASRWRCPTSGRGSSCFRAAAA